MNTMLEKAAMAAAFAGADTLGLGTPEDLWEWMSDDQRDAMLAMVRAAFEVIREAELGVRMAGRNAILRCDASPYSDFSVSVGRGFTAMIDAILEEKA